MINSLLFLLEPFAGGAKASQGDLQREKLFLLELLERLVSVVASSAVLFLLCGEFVDRVLQDLEELGDALHLVASAVAALLVLLVSFLCSADLCLEELEFDFEGFDLPVVEDGKDVFQPARCEEVVALVLKQRGLVIKGGPKLDDILDGDKLTEVFDELVGREVGNENGNEDSGDE